VSDTIVLLVLTAMVVLLLAVHRSEGDLRRAVVEYALVAVLVVQLAATPSTAGMTAGVASGVTRGGQLGADLAGRAWRATFARPAAKASPPATTQPARTAKSRAKDRLKAAGRATSTSPPEPAAGSPTAPGAPGRAVLLGVLGGLALLVLGARRLRRHDLRRADALAMPLLAGLRLARGRRRRRAA
jgi:hypothetical protein